MQPPSQPSQAVISRLMPPTQNEPVSVSMSQTGVRRIAPEGTSEKR